MPTLFDEWFTYAEPAAGSYGSDGLWTDGDLSVRTVKGTIQPESAYEATRDAQGSRDSGIVRVYSSERLAAKERAGSDGGWVSKGGRTYQLDSEDPHTYLFGGHWIYSAHLVAPVDVPDAVAEAFA